MKKERPTQETKRIKARRRRGGDRQETSLPEEANLLAGLSRQVGNRAVERLAQERGGRITLRGMGPAALRLALRGITGSGALSTHIQRQEEPDAQTAEVVALNASIGVQTGKITIEPPKVEEYDVTGPTLRDIYGQLNPIEWGKCRWDVVYDYETMDGKATKVNITLKLTIRMPRWTDSNKASEAARREWQRMLTNLRTHEDGHADMARGWAQKFKDAMLRQPEDKLNDKYQQTLDALNAAEDKYDDDTQHGQSQGVSLDTTIQ